MRVGLTGGIASGKSTALRMFKEKGAKVLDCDKIAKALTRKGNQGYKRVVEAFGEGILDEEGRIDRRKLARIVFFNEDKRKLLNSLIHPLVYRKLKEKFRKFKEDDIVIVDVPLLVESGGVPLFQKVIVVYSEPSIQMERLIKRGLSEEEAKARMKAQASWQEKLKVADFVIRGDRGIEEMRKQVEEVWECLKNACQKMKDVVASTQKEGGRCL